MKNAPDLARLPKNDLASSPLVQQLEGLGAFRADVTGAGPVVYGLFDDRNAAERAASTLGDAGRTWVVHPSGPAANGKMTGLWGVAKW